MSEHPLTLPKEWARDEKYEGVLWISTTDTCVGHEVYIEVENARWLFVSVMPMNNPAVPVSVMEISKEALAANLHHNCDGWVAESNGGVLEDFLRFGEHGCILSIERIEEVVPDYARRLKALRTT